MSKKQEAQISVIMSEKRKAITAHAALRLETLRTTKGEEVKISVNDNALLIEVKANTLSELRALLNSYLRWLTMISRTLKVLDMNVHSANSKRNR